MVVFDSLTYAGSLESLKDVASDPRFTFVQADVTDRAAVAAALAAHRPTAIVNFAAETHVDRSIDGPRAFVTTNVVGTFELLDAARRYAADLDAASRAAFRFLHVSTDEVYGSLGPTGLFSEDDGLCAQLALCRVQGRGRPPGARVSRDVRAADAAHQLLQ